MIAQCDLEVLAVDLTCTQLALKRCTPFCSGAVARPWPAAAVALQRNLDVLVADLTSTQLPLKRYTPSCSGAAVLPWPAASAAAQFDFQVLERCTPSCS